MMVRLLNSNKDIHICIFSLLLGSLKLICWFIILKLVSKLLPSDSDCECISSDISELEVGFLLQTISKYRQRSLLCGPVFVAGPMAAHPLQPETRH